MRKIIYLLGFLFTVTTLGATKYLQGDAVKSLDLSKTWTFPAATATLAPVASPTFTGTVTASGDFTASGSTVLGDAGFESTDISIDGTLYQSTFKVTDIDGTNYAQTILHRHSTTLEPLIVGARTNSDTTAHANVTAGQNLFSVYGAGYAGSDYKLFGVINIAASSSGTISGDSSPGKIVLSTTPNGSKTPVAAVTVESSGDVTLAVPLKLSSGGANKSLTASAGSIAYSDADSLEFTSVGSNGQLLQSAGTGTPVWSSTLVSPTSSGDLTLSNGGIKFPATQVLSADANTLDDYEEGTFTPTISGGTTAGAGTYSIQVGDYVKIGRKVTCRVYIGITAHTGTGIILLSGLPFTSATTGILTSIYVGIVENLSYTAGSTVAGYLSDASTSIIMIQSAPAASGAAVSMDTAFSLSYTITYFI